MLFNGLRLAIAAGLLAASGQVATAQNATAQLFVTARRLEVKDDDDVDGGVDLLYYKHLYPTGPTVIVRAGDVERPVRYLYALDGRRDSLFFGARPRAAPAPVIAPGSVSSSRRPLLT